MRIFVTGASGVIGSRVVAALLAGRHEVTAAVRSPARAAELARRGVTTSQVDLFAPDELQAAMVGHDVVINLATHVPPSTAATFLPGAWRANDRLRREGSAQVVDAALGAGVSQLIQESFAPIYVDGGDAWLDEHAPVHPARYNRSTLDAEASAARFTTSGRTGIVLRFGNFYGPDSYQVADMIALVRHGWLPLLGPPRSYFSSVSHDDAAAAVVAALDVPAGIYNVVDDEPLRHREYADALADALGVRPPRLPPAWAAYLGGSVGRTLARSLRISNGTLRAESAWAPRYPSVREGFRAIAHTFPPREHRGALSASRARPAGLPGP